MTEIPAAAITAAAKVIHSLTCGECDYHPDDLTVVSARDREDAAQVLKAAAPHLVCCQYDGCDCQKAGRAAERDAIIAMASELRASIPADHPKGARASFADYLQVTRDVAARKDTTMPDTTPDWYAAELAAGDGVCRHPTCDCTVAVAYRAGRAAERERIRQLLLSDQATEAAANASDEWFGKDQDLKFGLSETSKAQARVELAAVAELLDAP